MAWVRMEVCNRDTAIQCTTLLAPCTVTQRQVKQGSKYSRWDMVKVGLEEAPPLRLELVEHRILGQWSELVRGPFRFAEAKGRKTMNKLSSVRFINANLLPGHLLQAHL